MTHTVSYSINTRGTPSSISFAIAPVARRRQRTDVIAQLPFALRGAAVKSSGSASTYVT